DGINAETVELLAPYFELEGFNAAAAAHAAPAADALLAWVRAVTAYYEASRGARLLVEAAATAVAAANRAAAAMAGAVTQAEGWRVDAAGLLSAFEE
ncbi:unnamed protein product, partial [Phaeothamnion confervicola]